MKKMGNTKSNLYFNPNGIKPSIPLDVDEADPAMERFIRQKYEKKAYMADAPPKLPIEPMHAESTGSSGDYPPPPPPKHGRRFGFGLRSSSSALVLGRSQGPRENSRKETDITSIQVKKSSNKVIGASIGVTESEQGLGWKLLQLKEMGFQDEQKNSNILKGLDGDLERTVESLVRLGEGTRPGSIRTPASSEFPGRQRPLSPRFTAGARVVSAQNASYIPHPSAPASSSSNNPFDVLGSAANPQQSIESIFSNMNVSTQHTPQSTQTLFPHATGGHARNPMQQTQMESQHPMPPLEPQSSQQFPHHTNPYAQQQQTNSPFLLSPQQNNFIQSPTNPFSLRQSNTSLQTPFDYQQNPNNQVLLPSQGQFTSQQFSQQFSQQLPQQQQQTQSWMQPSQLVQQQEHLQSPYQLISPPPFPPTAPQSFYAPQSPYGPLSPLNLQSPYQQQMPPLSAQSTGRIDNARILALYNHPQLAPAPPAPSSQISDQTSTDLAPQSQAAQTLQGANGPLPRSPQRSVTMPVSASWSKNPFLPAGGPQQPSATTRPAGPWPASRESSDSGRQSPDAFASLSARYVR